MKLAQDERLSHLKASQEMHKMMLAEKAAENKPKEEKKKGK